MEREATIPADDVRLRADLAVPDRPAAVVLFAHGTGSGRRSPRNRQVAEALREVGMATLLLDLLTEGEERSDLEGGHLRFDVGLLASRLGAALRWAAGEPETGDLPVGLFGASTGAAAALVASTEEPVRAVVSRGGRPDLAGDSLERVTAPTLLIVGSLDLHVLDLNRQAAERLPARKEVAIVEGATHLFEEPGALEEVATLAAGWFARHLS